MSSDMATLFSGLCVQQIKGTHFAVSSDASETLLAKVLALDFCGNLMHHSICSNEGCCKQARHLKVFNINGDIERTTTYALNTVTLPTMQCLRLLGERHGLCGGTWKELPFEYLDDEAPLVLVLVASEPQAQVPTLQLNYPSSVDLFNCSYNLQAVSFHTWARDMHSSGHYKCTIDIGNGWIVYNGLQTKNNPPFIKKVRGPTDRKMNHLDICLIVYVRP